MKRLTVLAALLVLSSCGDSGPTSAQIEGAVNERMSEQHAQAVKLYGPAAANLHAIPPDAYKIAAVDNIRSSDEATYLADVTLEFPRNGKKDTRALTLRQIEGAWRVVSP